MNSIHRLALLGILAFAFDEANLVAAENTSASAPRERLLLDADWRFRLGDPADVSTNVTWFPELPDLKKLQLGHVSGTNSETHFETRCVDLFVTRAGEDVSFVQPDYDDRGWRPVALPHDWAVELPFDRRADFDHGFKAVGDPVFGTNNIGWYRREFVLPTSDAGKNLYLEFDGVYRNCLVWLNGHILGRNVSGYASFGFDATPYAHPGGTNVLVVRVDASRFEGWFYEGAGIYRHVWLTKVNPIHVPQWGTFVYTKSLSGSNAIVAIETEVTNRSAVATSAAAVVSTIYDATGKTVASVTSALNIPAGQQRVAKQNVSFAANLWSPKTPYLYQLVTTISNANAVADIYHTPFGVRTVTVDPDTGVSINGERIEILGMCNHQDHAGLGVALPDRLQYYRIERLLQLGANAYRTSHNAPTAELLDACDQLGMLVLDENRRMGTNAEPMSELTRQIRRDRNHPSVFMWSLGNEETGLQGNNTGADVLRVMQDATHALDATRFCTVAMNRDWGKGFSTVNDVQGFNYFMPNMDKFRAQFPNQRCLGTEVASMVSDRGVYTNDAKRGYVAGYDTRKDKVGWGAPAQEWWPFYNARPWASGGFAWTGFDYRGEPSPYWKQYLNVSSHFGTLDTCGFFKDVAYYYQLNWTLKPVLHLFPHWNWETPGQPIDLWVFGSCDSVELFVNGASQGRKPFDPRKHAEWKVPYAPGSIRAVGYRSGEPVLTNTIVTAGAPAQIALTPDRDVILADGRDVSVITVAVLDAKGNFCPASSNHISFAITGGKIIGVGNGDPSCFEADKADHRSVFNGLAQVIVQSTKKAGRITLTATAPGLAATELKLAAVKSLPVPAAPTGVSAIGGDHQVAVSWDIVPGATTYNLGRSTKRGGSYTLIAENISGVALGYVDKSVTNGTKYYYVVSANRHGHGTSQPSAEVSATPAVNAGSRTN